MRAKDQKDRVLLAGFVLQTMLELHHLGVPKAKLYLVAHEGSARNPPFLEYVPLHSLHLPLVPSGTSASFKLGADSFGSGVLLYSSVSSESRRASFRTTSFPSGSSSNSRRGSQGLISSARSVSTVLRVEQDMQREETLSGEESLTRRVTDLSLHLLFFLALFLSIPQLSPATLRFSRPVPPSPTQTSLDLIPISPPPTPSTFTHQTLRPPLSDSLLPPSSPSWSSPSRAFKPTEISISLRTSSEPTSTDKEETEPRSRCGKPRWESARARSSSPTRL